MSVIHLKQKYYSPRQGRIVIKKITTTSADLAEQLNSGVAKENHFYEVLKANSPRRFRCVFEDGTLPNAQHVHDVADTLGLSYARLDCVVRAQEVRFPGIVFANRNVEAAFASHVQGIDHRIYDDKVQLVLTPRSSNLVKKDTFEGVVDDSIVAENMFVTHVDAAITPVAYFQGYNHTICYTSTAKRPRSAVVDTKRPAKKAKPSDDLKAIKAIASDYCRDNMGDNLRVMSVEPNGTVTVGGSFECPITGVDHVQTTTAQLFIDLTFQKVFQVLCRAPEHNHARPTSVCQACRYGSHKAAVHRAEATGLRNVCDEHPGAELRFPTQGLFLKFGGVQTPKTYHGRALLDDIAGRCVHAIRTDQYITIMNSSEKGTGKSYGAMYVARRIHDRYRDDDAVSFLWPTSRTALSAQWMVEIRSSSGRNPKESAAQQPLVHIRGSDISADRLPAVWDSNKEMDVGHYQEETLKGRLWEARNMVIQTETMWRLGEDSSKMRSFKVVVLDEWTAQLQQLLSTNISPAHQQLIVSYHFELIKKANVVVAMCADMCDFGRKILMEMRPPTAATYEVRLDSIGKEVHIVNPEETKCRVVNHLLASNRNNSWIASNSLNEVRDLYNKILNVARDKMNIELMNGLVRFTGKKKDVADLTKKELLQTGTYVRHTPSQYWDINNEGEIEQVANTERRSFTIRAFIHNHAITHGVSVTSDHYNAVFGLFTGNMNCSARSCFQQLCRVRNAPYAIVGIKECIPNEKTKDDFDHERRTKTFLEPSSLIDLSQDLVSRLAAHFKQESIKLDASVYLRIRKVRR